MKRIIKSFIIISGAMMISSCNLDFAPENTMVDEITYKDEKTAEAALLGAYTRLNACYSGAPTDQNNYTNIGYMMMFAEMGTPTLKIRNNSDWINMETSNYTSADHNGYILEIWKMAYNAIDYANNIITNVNKYGDYDAATMAQHIAEGKFLRAYEHFLLLQAYGDGALAGDMNGLGVIIRLTPYDGYNPDDVASRSTVGESYTQIIKDLQEALPYLPNKNTNTNTINERIRASKTAAYALLSRIYLYKGTFGNNLTDIKSAADFADSVLVNASALGYTFSTSNTQMTGTMFPLNVTGTETNLGTYSAEVIFLAPCYTSASKYANGVGSSYFSKGNFYIDSDFINQYPAGDKRGYIDATVGSGLIWQGSDNPYPSDKTSFKFNNGNGYNNVIYLRLSEIMLTKAEALARLNGVNAESIKYLNDINKRNYVTKPTDYTAADFADAQALIDRILLERMKELAYEGHTRFDLIRTNRPLRDATIPTNKKILPIPDYDVRISYGKIQQNTGYR